MKLVVGASVGLGLILAAGGFWSYWNTGNRLLLMAGLLFGGLLGACGILSRRAIKFEFASGVINFLVAIFFAYRLIASEQFVPNGILLIVAFVTLFLVVLGIFLDLERAR